MITLEEGEQHFVGSLDQRSGGEGESRKENSIGSGNGGETSTRFFVTSYSPSDSTTAISIVSTTAYNTALSAGGGGGNSSANNSQSSFGSGQSFQSYGSEPGIGATYSVEKTVQVHARQGMGNQTKSGYAGPEWQQEKLKNKGKFVV